MTEVNIDVVKALRDTWGDMAAFKMFAELSPADIEAIFQRCAVQIDQSPEKEVSRALARKLGGRAPGSYAKSTWLGNLGDVFQDVDEAKIAQPHSVDDWVCSITEAYARNARAAKRALGL